MKRRIRRKLVRRLAAVVGSGIMFQGFICTPIRDANPLQEEVRRFYTAERVGQSAIDRTIGNILFFMLDAAVVQITR